MTCLGMVLALIDWLPNPSMPTFQPRVTQMAEVRGSTLERLYVVPEARESNQGEETYVGIINPGTETLQLELFGFDASGLAFPRAERHQQINPGQKHAFVIRDLYPAVFENVAWLQIGADGVLLVYVELRAPGARSAYWANSALEMRAFMPHIASDTVNFETVLAAINVSPDPATTMLTRKPGDLSADLTAHADPYGKSRQAVAALFGETLPPNIWGELESTSPVLAAMESFATLPDRTQIASLGLNNQSGQSLRFLHVAVQTQSFWTGMVYINVGNAPTAATETYFAADGNILKSHVEDVLAPGGKITLLFDSNNQERVPPGTSWVWVTADQPLVGYELFGTPVTSPDDTFTGLQGNFDDGNVLVYPHFQSSEQAFTAVVAVNLGDQAADISFSAMDDNGAVLETATESGVPPGVKLARLAGTGGGSLFSNPDTLARAAWIRATASGSRWAGFQLWGDQGVPSRQFLSGLTAHSPQGEVRGDLLEEAEPNNDYQTAQVLQTNGTGWDLNVVAQVEKTDRGEVINLGGLDDLEDVFTITLQQTTPLVIAVAPEDPLADLELFVFSEPLESDNFFDLDPQTDPRLDYRAHASGDEVIARVFEAGTYYLLVSLSELAVVDQTDYGLVVTSAPLLLETFETPDVLERWTAVSLDGDSDGLPQWQFAAEALTPKLGSSLLNAPAIAGQTEASLLYSPFFEVPQSGVTLVDAHIAWIYENPLSDPGLAIGSVDENLAPSLVSSPLPAFQEGPLQYDGELKTWSGWIPWIEWSMGCRQSQRGCYVYELERSRQVAFGISTTANRESLHLDNVAVVNIITTAQPGGSKRAGLLSTHLHGKKGNQ